MDAKDQPMMPAPVTATLRTLAARWRRDADAYSKLVEEARRAGTPWDQMLSLMTALRACAKELEQLAAKLEKETEKP